MKNYFQFPYNNKKLLSYSNQECLDANCAIDLIDKNGTGINSFSLNETFTYIDIEAKEGENLDEDLDDTISKIGDLFLTGFNNDINILIMLLLIKH